VHKVAIFAGHNHDTWDKENQKGIYTDLTENGVYEEFNTNIVIAKETVELLEHQEGIEVLFPQSDGRKMTLKERVEFCNDNNVDVAIFIHSNASGNKNASGAAAFYWYNSPKGEKFANIYADEMKAKGYPLWSHGTYPCKPNTWSNFYVVRNTYMPVILTENFFFTNPEELKKYLLDEKQLHNIAEIHAKTTCRYFGIEYVKPKQKETFFRVVTGSFQDEDNADKRVEELEEAGFTSFIDVYEK